MASGFVQASNEQNLERRMWQAMRGEVKVYGMKSEERLDGGSGLAG